MGCFEPINFSTLTILSFLHHIHVICSEFEVVSMTSSHSIEIFSEEILAAVSSNHWIDCVYKCKKLETPSTCNTIHFDQLTKSCLLAQKDVIQNICPSISKRSPGEWSKRRKREGFLPFSSNVFAMQSLFPNGRLKL